LEEEIKREERDGKLGERERIRKNVTRGVV